MNRFLNFILLLALGVNLSNAFSLFTSDAKMENLKGSVKSVATYKFSKNIYFHTDTIAKYKRLGKPLPKYEKELWKESQYDDSGMKTYDLGWFKELYSYNSQNQKTLLYETQKRYDQDGALIRIYEMTFDEDWIPSGGKAVDGKGDLIFTETYKKTILPDGNIQLDGEHVSADGDIQYVNITLRPNFSMSKLSQKSVLLRQEILLNEKELPYRIIEDRSGKETILEIEYTSDGRKVYQVDKQGNRKLSQDILNDRFENPVREIYYNELGEVQKDINTSYRYDSYGNWVHKEIRKTADAEPEIYERDIVYY